MDSEIWKVVIQVVKVAGMPGLVGFAIYYFWRVGRENSERQAKMQDILEKQVKIEEQLLGVVKANTEALGALKGEIGGIKERAYQTKEFNDVIVLYTEKLTKIIEKLDLVISDLKELLRRGF